MITKDDVMGYVLFAKRWGTFADKIRFIFELDYWD
jgi:hypothetical protein